MGDNVFFISYDKKAVESFFHGFPEKTKGNSRASEAISVNIFPDISAIELAVFVAKQGQCGAVRITCNQNFSDLLILYERREFIFNNLPYL